jgi:hypothetical protein
MSIKLFAPKWRFIKSIPGHRGLRPGVGDDAAAAGQGGRGVSLVAVIFLPLRFAFREHG